MSQCEETAKPGRSREPPEPLAKAPDVRATAGDRPAPPPLDEVHGAYRLRFAQDDADRERIYALRYLVFGVELGEALEGADESLEDRDEYDPQFDHLMVEEIATGRAVGTYRLATAEMAAKGLGFYSASEFELAGLPPGVESRAVELGRACVAREHRNKAVLFLLWRGLAAYLTWHGKRYFFGCSSLTSRDPAEGLALHRDFVRQGTAPREPRVRAREGFRCEGEPARGKIAVPKLFAIYLRHGASVLSEPAIDRRFGTIDWLTFLDVETLEPRLFSLFAAGLPQRAVEPAP
jgi:putative hemolysin